MALALLSGCKGDPAKPTPQPTPTPVAIDAAPVVDPWATCEAALREAATVVDNRRANVIVGGCTPCGDWTPLLHWRTPQADGGPSRMAIEQTMVACGFCDPNAKQAFLGSLDDARGTTSRAPWRLLGGTCKELVSAVPDARFMSPVFYALDRIARAAATRPETARLLEPIRLPLPAVSISSIGLELPHGAVTTPSAGPFHITVLPTEIRIGRLPRARLGSAGVIVDFGGEPYPGALVNLKALPAALATLVATDPTGSAPIAILAPHAMPAKPVYDVVRALPGRELVLAVGSPAKLELEGWAVPGTIPIRLVAGSPTESAIAVGTSADQAVTEITKRRSLDPLVIAIDPTTTTEVLARVLGAAAFKGAKTVTLVYAKRP